jgi:hypothetical protein
MSTPNMTAKRAPVAQPLRIDLLYLDLETCTRCVATDRSLESAIEATRELLAATGIVVEVNRVHVESAAQARALRFISSPTIRVNGRDLAIELRESPCGSEACTDGCGDQIACRVWVHEGHEHTEPPPALIADAILREVSGGTPVAPGPNREAYELPENLERFFAGKAAGQAEAATAEEPSNLACCSPREQRSCCDPEDKPECCDAVSEGPCGCR